MNRFRNRLLLAVAAMACGTLLVPSAPANAAGKKKIVFVAGGKSHGYGSHEHFAGCKLLAKCLQSALPDMECVVTKDGFPEDFSVFDDCAAVVIFSDGGGRHPAMQYLKEVDALADKGVGIACLHYAVEVPKGEPGEYLKKWIGGYFEPFWSVNPHWVAHFETFPDHPISHGLTSFEIDDEWYYHMRFRPGMEGVTPILSALPGPETLKRADGAHSNNPDVRAAVLERKEPQHLAWASVRADGHRGFGFTGGHHHWNWADPNMLRIVLNGVVWVAGCEVPEDGVPLGPVTMDDLLKNQDYEQPGNFDSEATQQRFHVPR